MTRDEATPAGRTAVWRTAEHTLRAGPPVARLEAAAQLAAILAGALDDDRMMGEAVARHTGLPKADVTAVLQACAQRLGTTARSLGGLAARARTPGTTHPSAPLDLTARAALAGEPAEQA